jgi:uncharacterized membrane protein YgdD (TMEM256/DUF423 family)
MYIYVSVLGLFCAHIRAFFAFEIGLFGAAHTHRQTERHTHRQTDTYAHTQTHTHSLSLSVSLSLSFTHTHTSQPGDKVCVVGNHPALGNWQVSNACVFFFSII